MFDTGTVDLGVGVDGFGVATGGLVVLTVLEG